MNFLPKPTTLQSKRLLQKLCLRLALAPTRTCKSLHECVLCGLPIRLGQEYKDRGYGARAHVDCFKTVNAQVNA